MTTSMGGDQPPLALDIIVDLPARPIAPLHRCHAALPNREARLIDFEEAGMERLIFQCPTTGDPVDVGVATEIRTLLQIRSSCVRAMCPACGRHHQWPVSDAFLAEAA
jgi:hypothetical protein